MSFRAFWMSYVTQKVSNYTEFQALFSPRWNCVISPRMDAPVCDLYGANLYTIRTLHYSFSVFLVLVKVGAQFWQIGLFIGKVLLHQSIKIFMCILPCCWVTEACGLCRDDWQPATSSLSVCCRVYYCDFCQFQCMSHWSARSLWFWN